MSRTERLENNSYTPEELAEIKRINAEEMAAVAFDLRYQEWTYEMGFDPMSEPPETKTYKVRFYHTGFYEIEVEAKNDDEADDLAKALFEEHLDNARLLRADFGHMTLEVLEQGGRS